MCGKLISTTIIYYKKPYFMVFPIRLICPFLLLSLTNFVTSSFFTNISIGLGAFFHKSNCLSLVVSLGLTSFLIANDQKSYLLLICQTISFVTLQVPPQCNSGVLMRISQSITNMFPRGERITFSSCISLK